MSHCIFLMHIQGRNKNDFAQCHRNENIVEPSSGKLGYLEVTDLDYSDGMKYIDDNIDNRGIVHQTQDWELDIDSLPTTMQHDLISNKHLITTWASLRTLVKNKTTGRTE